MKSINKKIVSINQLYKYKLNRKIGLCWGGFDLLHAGHILHFEFASQKCNTLIVAINSDETFPDKGENRPLLSEKSRANIIASIEFVDFVTIYYGNYLDPDNSKGIIHGIVQNTPYIPLDIIIAIKPDFYFKGAEYIDEEIPEKKIVEENGGKIICGPNNPVFSSSELINKL
tara:strand:+ start:212 stop:727 length:516 start_codon:yes stop_codon:yes gene_type:complete